MPREVRHFFALHDLARGQVNDQAAVQQLIYDFSEGNVSDKEGISNLKDIMEKLYPSIALKNMDHLLTAPLNALINDKNLFNEINKDLHLILTAREQNETTQIKQAIIEKKLSDPKERIALYKILSTHDNVNLGAWRHYDAVIQLKTHNIRNRHMIEHLVWAYSKGNNPQLANFLGTLSELFPPKDYEWAIENGEFKVIREK